MYGILGVTWLETKTMSIRHWVAEPDGKLRLFENLDTAQLFAEAMNRFAEDNGIVIAYFVKIYEG